MRSPQAQAGRPQDSGSEGCLQMEQTELCLLDSMERLRHPTVMQSCNVKVPPSEGMLRIHVCTASKCAQHSVLMLPCAIAMAIRFCNSAALWVPRNAVSVALALNNGLLGLQALWHFPLLQLS
eukprot:scaffold24324_cov28-Tisochrysis_lutea.AAC.2